MTSESQRKDRLRRNERAKKVVRERVRVRARVSVSVGSNNNRRDIRLVEEQREVF